MGELDKTSAWLIGRAGKAAEGRGDSGIGSMGSGSAVRKGEGTRFGWEDEAYVAGVLRIDGGALVATVNHAGLDPGAGVVVAR
jgi:hypothetical protein